MSATLEMETLMTTLRGATDEQWLAFMKLINEHGVPQFFASVDAKKAAAMAEEADEAAATAKPAKAAPKPKKEPKKEVVAAKPLPSAEDGETAPTADSYRLKAADIDETVCVGRAKDNDNRWKPIIYRERQCGKKLVDGSDLCAGCQKREEKYEDKAGPWLGRVSDDEPLSWLHMLGTAWAEKAKPKFNASASGSSASVASDAASDSGASEEMEVVEKKVAPKAKKVTAEEKESKKAAAAAEKEAAAAAKAAEKEAAAAVKAAEKEAAAAAKPKKEVKPKKEKEVKEVKEVKKSEKKPEKSEPKVAAASAAVVAVEFELEDIGGTVYAVRNGNVYDYDGDTE
jgi:histone H1/5